MTDEITCEALGAYSDEEYAAIKTFALVLAGGESNKVRAAELIRKFDAEARRDLRATLQELDNLIDDVWLEELREKRRGHK